MAERQGPEELGIESEKVWEGGEDSRDGSREVGELGLASKVSMICFCK